MNQYKTVFNQGMLIVKALMISLLFIWPFSAVFSAGLQPSIAISPPRIEMNSSSGAMNESITVLNLGNKPMSVEVSVQNWDLDVDNKYRALPPTAQSLDQWMIINPVHLEIPAHSQQTVRLAIRPRAEPEEGEHRAMIFFHQQPDPDKSAQINFNVGVPVYGYFGETKRQADIHSTTYDASNKKIMFDVSNTGNAYVRPDGQYIAVAAEYFKGNKKLLSQLNLKSGVIDDKNTLSSGKLALQPVLSGQRRDLYNAIKFDKEPQGDYYLALKATIAGQRIEKVFKVDGDKID